jgi:3-phosphoshikimate 1-carboxyvinyltransferase
MNRLVDKLTHPLAAELALPGSKSITLRNCILAALADGASILRAPGECDDYWRMKDCLRRLGIALDDSVEGVLRVAGRGGQFDSGSVELFTGQSAASTRLLMGVAALRPFPTLFDGHESMRARPNKLLLDAIAELGARVESRNDGYLPATITGPKTFTPRIRMKGDISSQYFSSLIQIGPLLPEGLVIDVEGELVSRPYVQVTLSEMKKFGVAVQNDDFTRFTLRPSRYRPQDLIIEGDASGASYFAALATMHGGSVRILNLGRSTVQGDYRFFELCERLGATIERGETETRITGHPERIRAFTEPVDMESMPDVAPTLMAMAPFIPGTTRIVGLATLRVKECDRIAAPATELRKLGVPVVEGPDWIEISEHRAEAQAAPVEIDTYDDHRIAMSFAVLGSLRGGLGIRNPNCVTKTFPRYWDELSRIYA